MKIGDILKTVGTGLIKSHPLGNIVLGTVSAVSGKQLDPETTTGAGLQAEVNNLPVEAREKLLLAEIQAEVEHDREQTKRFEVMNSKTGWIRPFIVFQFSLLITGSSCYFLYLLHLSIESAVTDNPAQSVGASIGLAVTAIGGLWPVILAVQSLPAAIIRSWFGFRERQKDREAAAAQGQSIPPLQGIVDMAKGFFNKS